MGPFMGLNAANCLHRSSFTAEAALDLLFDMQEVTLNVLDAYSGRFWSSHGTHRFTPPTLDRRAGCGAAQRERSHDPRLDWGREGSYLKLPGGGYPIPGAALRSRRGNCDLAGEFAEFDERFAAVTEEQVRAAVADDK
jgi:hypothetical protein